MQTIGIQALQPIQAFSVRPSTRRLSVDHPPWKAIGIAAAFDDALLDLGFMKWIAIRSFMAGDLSLAQEAQVVGKNQEETMRLLSNLNIPIADYDLGEDLETMELLRTRD